MSAWIRLYDVACLSNAQTRYICLTFLLAKRMIRIGDKFKLLVFSTGVYIVPKGAVNVYQTPSIT